ncbi:reverse transcriptase domain-containing protein [Tanacetum coccineum]
MLERLRGNEYYYFLDGVSGFFQIPIEPEDQEKTTFTCPYRTFAYMYAVWIMQCTCNLSKMHDSNFHDMVEDFMKVFMDDFLMFGNSFDCCLANLDRMLARCEETNLLLKNLAVDHLLRLENPDLGTFMEEEIADEFPDKHLMILKAELNYDEPCYADYVNYIVGKIVPPKWTPEKRRRFFSQVKNYYWDEPYAFRLCLDNLIRRCVAGSKILGILAHCHSGPTGGHHSSSITGRKVYESGFFWPCIFKDAKDYVMRCDACQITAYKTPTGCTPFRLVYGKACHLPVEIKHRAYWVLKQCNMDLTAAAKNHFMELNELIELRDGAYKNTRIYKERIKKWHDSRLRGDKNFKVGDKVLLFNSRFKMHPGKLKSKWYGPNVVKVVYPYGIVEITDKSEISFKVNDQRLKKYYDGSNDTDERGTRCKEIDKVGAVTIIWNPVCVLVLLAQYALEILKKHGMDKGESIGTPMATKTKLDAYLSGKLVDQTDYCSKIGSLVYLTSRRPDIMQAVCYCARYQARPTKKHLKEVKRIFRYLSGTINMGLWYPKDSGFELTAFLDVDHVGCLDTRKALLEEYNS